MRSKSRGTYSGGKQVDFSDPTVIFAAAFVLVVLGAALLTARH